MTLQRKNTNRMLMTSVSNVSPTHPLCGVFGSIHGSSPPTKPKMAVKITMGMKEAPMVTRGKEETGQEAFQKQLGLGEFDRPCDQVFEREIRTKMKRKMYLI